MNNEVNKWQLQRLVWQVRKRIEDADLRIPIDVFAEELADGFVVTLQATILGESKSAILELEMPANRWQLLKAFFGVPHKRAKIHVTAYQLFPDLQVPKDQKTIVYMESDDDAS